jgi:serine/threonine protein kinase
VVQDEDGCTGGNVGSDIQPSPEDLRRRQQRFKERFWLRPLDEQVKIIDFGGATYKEDSHNSIINTRQYRAPEVILECADWDEKSDIWSLVCIFIEMYTGELFYETREDIEHLAMIEK